MPMPKRLTAAMMAVAILLSSPAMGQGKQKMENMPSTANQPDHQQSAQHHQDTPPPDLDVPPLPEGMTLDEVFNYAESDPPASFPDPVVDDQWFGFVRFDQFEYRVTDDDVPDHLGWEADVWFGGDINKFWWKTEGEVIFDGPDEGESENDFLYSRLFTPFWSIQTGVQYANEWTPDDYGDRWSYVLGLQGLAPYQFELDNSLYVSEDGDLTVEVEGEYDLRIAQRLVLQPRVGLGFAAQDVPERNLGSGMTSGDLDMRLRYEVKREFAPYIGVRYQFLLGETEDIAAAAGDKTEQWMVLAGLRFAF
ncbi:copper resistance protein B [Halomonas sp. ZH2S]|uniref:Copper resistance protein B n=1 Tax=Vreelandella zhuhanensis TaxID=2684210 RepID=A0A7X3H1J0_9GAMM|nr:copper resistance protein B [Halomonas zhuhanensis]MWJ27893.1 copper resistance protein B [Halomonas zhuhanensis]